MPSRTGKQCRERYFNHLKPSLNRSAWSPQDDALLYQLYSTMGPKWAAIAGLLRGRNSNGAKNRFHAIRRRLEKDSSKLVSDSSKKESPTPQNLLNRLKSFKTIDESTSRMETVRILIDAFEKKRSFPSAPTHGFAFDLINVLCNDIVCSRCGLSVPSKQTGGKICKKTGWCESCSSTPAYMYRDLLRLAHTMLYEVRSKSKEEEQAEK